MTDEKIEINPSYYDPAGRIANPERVIEVGRPIRFATFKIRTAIYFGFWAAFGAFLFNLLLALIQALLLLAGYTGVRLWNLGR
ncbi:MAG TPA: hypothetical protein VIM11_27725 [Tepidisphaeraceae bacterium]